MPLIQTDHSFVWYLTQTTTPLVSTHHTFSYHFFTVYPTCLSSCLILTCPPPHPTFSVSIRVGPHIFKILHLQTSLPWHVLHFQKIHTQNPRSPHLLPNRPVISRTLFLNHPLPLRFTFLRTRTFHWKGATVHTQSLPTTTHLTTRSSVSLNFSSTLITATPSKPNTLVIFPSRLRTNPLSLHTPHPQPLPG